MTAPIDFGMDVLPKLLVEFRALHPQISVELLLTDTALDLATHRIDLALRASPSMLPDMGYRASSLIDFHLCLYASPSYLANRGTPSAPADIANHDLVVTRELMGAAALPLMHRSKRSTETRARPVIRTSDYASAHRIVLAGGGIGVIPDIVVAPSLASGTIERVLPEWTVASVRLHAISLGGREAPARVRLFRDFMRAELAAALDIHSNGSKDDAGN